MNNLGSFTELLLLFGAIFALLVVFIIIAVYFAVSWHSSKVWLEFANDNNLSYQGSMLFPKPSSISGTYRGRLLSFFIVSSSSIPIYTRGMVTVHNPRDVALTLLEKSILLKIDKLLLNRQDIELNDRKFDDCYLLESVPEDFAERVLASTELRQRLLQIKSVNIKLEGQKLIYERKGGVERNKEQIKAIFDILVDLAEAIERVGDSEGRDLHHFERNIQAVSLSNDMGPQWVQGKNPVGTHVKWYLESLEGDPITKPKIFGILDKVIVMVIISSVTCGMITLLFQYLLF